MLITPGELTMVVPENFYETIRKSIEVNLQIVSGAVGLAVSWLGFPDLMSNRAVADSIGEPLEIVAANDITSWKSFYEQLFNNVIKIRNANIKSDTKPLQIGIVKPLLKPMSDRVWQQLIRFYLPSCEDGIITREGFLSRIPGFDISEENKRRITQIAYDEKNGLIQAVNNKANSTLDNRADTGQQSVGSRKNSNIQGNEK
jgi:hypothetical protein